MLSHLAILVLLIPLSWGCAAKHIPLPMPVAGIDIAIVKSGQTVPFNGTLFSPSYLNNYLQWKCTDQGKC